MITLSELEFDRYNASEYIKDHRCQCGGLLTLAYVGGEHVIRCGNDIAHSDFGKPVTIPLSEQGFSYIKQPNWRKDKMAEAKAIVKHEGVSLTEQAALDLFRAGWPKAPDKIIKKGAIICRDYGLHPYMGHLFPIPFNEGKPNETWALVMSIKATRLIAGRKRRFSYIDESPRMMTDQEQKTVFGEVDLLNFWSITILRDEQGNIYRGYGCWPKDQKPYGTEKGNTKHNMAHIRSERKAIDRAVPDTLPDVPDVIDSEYVELPPMEEIKEEQQADFESEKSATAEMLRDELDIPPVDEVVDTVVDPATGEIIEKQPEQPATEPQAPEGELPKGTGAFDFILDNCPEHGDPLKEDKYQQFTHKMPDNNFCHAVKENIRRIVYDIRKKHNMTDTDFLNRCKKKYEGKTPSQITQRQMIDLLNEIDS